MQNGDPMTATPANVLLNGLASLLVIAGGMLAAASPAAAQANADAIKRGEYVFRAADCAPCHTDTKNKGAQLAGGRALPTPFGTFYSPNITADPVNGIGKWTDADFTRALREGISPNGSHYFPVFPYTSFTLMTDQDIKDLKAYIFSLPPVAQANKPHDIGFPFNLRFLQIGWKMLFFKEGVYKPDPAKSAEWNRGAYLTEALGHCAECHTPRNLLGGMDRSRWMAGSIDGPEGEMAPNITPHEATGIGEWDDIDFAYMLKTGAVPGGDVVGGLMAEVVRESTSKMTDADRTAMSKYILSLPPIDHKIERPR